MTDSTARFSDPIVRAFERMARILFQLFSIEKWLVIGFAAWLAGLTSGSPANVSWALNGAPGKSALAPVETGSGPVVAARSIQDASGSVAAARTMPRFEDLEWDTGWPWFLAACGTIALGFILGVFVLLVWLSSRATFVFLDDVVRDAAEIVRPWRELGPLGDSLFLWRLVFGLVVLVGIGLAVGGTLGLSALTGVPVFLVPLFLTLAIAVPAVIYVDVFLRHFVVPVMYLHGLTATAAWGRFLGLFRQRPLPFLVYGLLLLALWMGIGMAVLVVGFFTCCLGLLFVGLPYVGTVLLLPVHVFFRQLGLEFLAQFGPEFDARTPATAAAAAGSGDG